MLLRTPPNITRNLVISGFSSFSLDFITYCSKRCNKSSERKRIHEMPTVLPYFHKDSRRPFFHECSVSEAFITRKLLNIWSWQVFWLAPSSMPSHSATKQWLLEYRGHIRSLQQRCLLRIFTWFPFHSSPLDARRRAPKSSANIRRNFEYASEIAAKLLKWMK